MFTDIVLSSVPREAQFWPRARQGSATNVVSIVYIRDPRRGCWLGITCHHNNSTNAVTLIPTIGYRFCHLGLWSTLWSMTKRLRFSERHTDFVMFWTYFSRPYIICSVLSAYDPLSSVALWISRATYLKFKCWKWWRGLAQVRRTVAVLYQTVGSSRTTC